jgi:hypothetical protein
MEKTKEFEWVLKCFETTKDVMSSDFDAEMNKDGWVRQWASIGRDGTCIVYRRPIPKGRE